jgi:simple sugar transport system substrate-binding protein
VGRGSHAPPGLVKFLHGQPIDNVDTGVKVYTKDNIAEVAKK